MIARTRRSLAAAPTPMAGLALGIASLGWCGENAGQFDGRLQLLGAAIAAVLDRQQADELEGDGRPSLAAVGKEAGFKVTKTQFDAAWPQYVDSLGADDEDQDD